MTEDEAKTKACFRAATFGASQQLADGPGPHCIGSACMGWRVVREEVSGTDADGFGYVRSAVTGGYCGPAGAPQ